MKLIRALPCAVFLFAHAIRGTTAGASPISLLLPQSYAFALLGHSCGGIQEKAYATGFDPISGYPVGEVHLQTRCGGSGRGGGYHTTTYSAWAAVTWNFSGQVIAWSRQTNAVSVSSTFTATDANGDTLYNTGTAAYLTVPAPIAPSGLTASEVGDQFQVAWSDGLANPEVITSSTIMAAPVASSAPILVSTISGSAETGLVGPLEPATTYEITVVSTTIGGSSPPSDPVFVTTTAASLVPSAPTGVTARWISAGATTGTLLASWNAAVAGNSPVDEYLITINGSDGGGTFTQTVSGTTLTASFVVDFIPDWSVTVRAHNAAGWGPLSARFTLGGL